MMSCSRLPCVGLWPGNSGSENKEQVPTKFPADDYRPLAEVIAGYYEAYGGDPRNGFSQENYASKLYRGQQYAGVYGSWFREAINIAVRVRERDIG